MLGVILLNFVMVSEVAPFLTIGMALTYKNDELIITLVTNF
jgi:hypothetical protein